MTPLKQKISTDTIFNKNVILSSGYQYFRAVSNLFTNEPDLLGGVNRLCKSPLFTQSRSIRWCKQIMQKSSVYSEYTSVTDRQ